MKAIIPIVAALAALITCGVAQATATCEGQSGGGAVKLTVEATSLRNATGEVAITLYGDDKRRFLARGGKLLRARVPAVAPVTTACFWVKPGFYAIAQYHDENADHDFNRTLLSPKEGFGFSNDAKASLGLPSFQETRFEVPAKGRSIRIAMRYAR